MRKIPATMATQHPDNSCAPYWEKDGDGFVSSYEEVQECHSSFRDLGCEEYMWDWEGKYVEEAVVERLFQGHYEYFKKHPLGRDRFLTFRIPNIWQETGHSLTRAMMCILTAEDVAKHLGLHRPPLFEVILPMTKKAEEIMHIESVFTKLARYTCELFGHSCSLNRINVMPLFEGVDDMLRCKDTLERYLSLYRRAHKRAPEYMRVHIARSDPAMNSGVVAAVIAGKVALSDIYEFGERRGIPVFPAIGVGTLPFRGGLSPLRIREFMKEYSGMRTVYVQSAFRYDFPLPKVKAAVRLLNREMQKTKPRMLADRKDRAAAEALIPMFAAPYRAAVEALAPTITSLAKHVPRRRERKQHVGLFGYSRGIGKKRLPRAIPFTAVMYSLGVPPEFIGTGFGLQAARKAGLDPERFYLNLRADLAEAGRYLNKNNLLVLARRSRAWKRILDDVALAEKALGMQFGPRETSDFHHLIITSKLLDDWQNGRTAEFGGDIIVGGKLRKSLG